MSPGVRRGPSERSRTCGKPANSTWPGGITSTSWTCWTTRGWRPTTRSWPYPRWCACTHRPSARSSATSQTPTVSSTGCSFDPERRAVLTMTDSAVDSPEPYFCAGRAYPPLAPVDRGRAAALRRGVRRGGRRGDWSESSPKQPCALRSRPRRAEDGMPREKVPGHGSAAFKLRVGARRRPTGKPCDLRLHGTPGGRSSRSRTSCRSASSDLRLRAHRGHRPHGAAAARAMRSTPSSGPVGSRGVTS